MRGAQQDRCAHRMAEREQRRRAVRQHDLLDEALEIEVVLGEAADVAFATIGKRTPGTPLPAPVEHRDRKAPRPRVVYHFEILLDEFGPARKNAQRAFAPGRRLPHGITQRDPVRRRQGADLYAFGHRVCGNRDEFHVGEVSGRYRAL